MKYECDVCKKSFRTKQALASHQRYRHPARVGSVREEEGAVLDLKQDFKKILADVGVGKIRNVIADVVFDYGSDDLEKVENVLRQAGVGNPAKTMILVRWGQRVGSKIPEKLLKDETKRGNDIFDVYDRMMQEDMRTLIMEDLKARIEEKRGKKDRRVDEGEGLRDKLSEILSELRLQGRAQRERQRPPHMGNCAWPCDDPSHSPSCMICGNCGFHGYIDHILPDRVFSCPECGVRYVNTPY